MVNGWEDVKGSCLLSRRNSAKECKQDCAGGGSCQFRRRNAARILEMESTALGGRMHH
jgi:hypothetical protein